MKIYWTDAVTGKGFVISASRKQCEDLLMTRFEASSKPIEGVEYPAKAIPCRGVFYPKMELMKALCKGVTA